MSKSFSEVFGKLNMAPEYGTLIENAPIVKITLTEERSRLNVYIKNDGSISRPALVSAENAVRQSLFADKGVSVAVLSVTEEREGSSHRDKSVAGEKDQTVKYKKRPGQAGYKEKENKFTPKADRKSQNPDVIFGYDFKGEPLPISTLEVGSGAVVIEGKVFGPGVTVTKNGKFLFTFNLTDGTDSVTAKLFVEENAKNELVKELADGVSVAVSGEVEPPNRYMDELSIGKIKGIRRIPDKASTRMDEHPGEKRVELNLHTRMSEMDGTGDIGAYMRLASAWGWKALAITDNDSVQIFPEAYHLLSKMPELKLIYGVTGNLVNDDKKACFNPHGQSLSGEFVVFDIETTGFSMQKDQIIEIGAVKVNNKKITDRFSVFVDPERAIPGHIASLTGISDEDVKGAGTYRERLPEFLEFAGDAPVVGHNAMFDVGFIKNYASRLDIRFDPTVVDTLGLSYMLLKRLMRNRLDNIAKELDVPLSKHHRAVADAEATAGIFIKFTEMLEKKGIYDLDALYNADKIDLSTIKKLHAAPFTILVKNDLGRTNLYRLISAAHVDYLYNVPRMPRSAVNFLREGLLIGSGNEDGDFFDKVARGFSDEELIKEAAFYDYLEIIPPDAVSWLINDNSSPISSMEDIYAVERKIADIAERAGIPLVASGNTHFADPGGSAYRKIIKYSAYSVKGRKFNEEKFGADLYLRTTDEMLASFEFLGKERAYSAVIAWPSEIADMVEPIAPVRPDKCPPVLADSDKELKETCYANAEKMYGTPLPELVRERLDKELDSVILNGYSVMYISAKKIVEDSMNHGYLVGSRGSVGSSIAATCAGISEVNPLPPHYRCRECRFSDFDSDIVREYRDRTGYDLPDRECPVCGKPLIKDGFNIPFETFLGFKGDKEPDIDLNVAGEYQSRAHAYTEELFGKGQTYRAGTIGTIQEKTAHDCVLKFNDEYPRASGDGKGGISAGLRRAEAERLSKGLVRIKRTTGQHPGGIIVLPQGEEMYSFTPIQYPANNSSSMVTTHFDFHSIDSNLLKLDILGKDDPSMARMLYELTGLDPMDVPIGTPEVMDIFFGTGSLGITPEDIGGTPLGTLGIPEFNTDFAIKMLIEAKPRYVSDLVRITGLAHGQDVWVGNAQKLIQDGVCTIDTAICTRDDIMTYLIGMGVPSDVSFKIMELVRKNKFNKDPDHDKFCEIMRANQVPDWYITSLETITYLFPKAHAAAYVVMLWRIAYYKVHYPLEYYAAYFSVKGKGFDYEKMCVNLAGLRQNMSKLKAEMSEKPKPSDEDKLLLRDMRLAEEMMARGFEFVPIDIYKAAADRFTVTPDRKLMPSLDSVAGLGEVAARSIESASRDGLYLSIEDFISRTRVSRTNASLLKRLGILGNLPENNQMSLFDFKL